MQTALAGHTTHGLDIFLYPANLERKEFLKYYSQVFDFVEIDSSFYSPPNLFMTKRWASITSDKFRFEPSFPYL